MKTFLRFTGIMFIAACVLILGGCPKNEEDEIDPGLVGSWSNQKQGDELKTFKIESDGSFIVQLTVASDGGHGTGTGTVEGVLVRDGDEYYMNNMKETTGEPGWGSALSLFNRTYVQITLSNNNDTFVLACSAAPLVQQFFGGTFYKE